MSGFWAASTHSQFMSSFPTPPASTLKSFIPLPGLTTEAAPTQGQDLAPGLVQLHYVHIGKLSSAPPQPWPQPKGLSSAELYRPLFVLFL